MILFRKFCAPSGSFHCVGSVRLSPTTTTTTATRTTATRAATTAAGAATTAAGAATATGTPTSAGTKAAASTATGATAAAASACAATGTESAACTWAATPNAARAWATAFATPRTLIHHRAASARGFTSDTTSFGLDSAPVAPFAEIAIPVAMPSAMADLAVKLPAVPAERAAPT
jgi:hypothetical protein